MDIDNGQQESVPTKGRERESNTSKLYSMNIQSNRTNKV